MAKIPSFSFFQKQFSGKISLIAKLCLLSSLVWIQGQASSELRGASITNKESSQYSVINNLALNTDISNASIFDTNIINTPYKLNESNKLVFPSQSQVKGGQNNYIDTTEYQLEPEIEQSLPPEPVVPFLPPPPPELKIAFKTTPVNTDTNKTDLAFPLAVPVAISSVFGLRIDPITGYTQLHSGTDLAAPIGTPVRAAYSGRVHVTGSLGGYGNTIIIRHEDDTQESLYAHLSSIMVSPGQWVEKGSIIGQVGNTGLSTGPHLHFEWRYLTANGAVPVDADLHIEIARENLHGSIDISSNN